MMFPPTTALEYLSKGYLPQGSPLQGSPLQGYLLIDKPSGMTSFSVIAILRKLLQVQKIGHTGTLDPFATGLLVVLIGRNYTRQASRFLADTKDYIATLSLGKA